MQQQNKVTISRKWNNPQIETVVDMDGIELSMRLDDFEKALLQEVTEIEPTVTVNDIKNVTLDDFKAALVKEIGSVALVFRQSTFEKIVDTAFQNVINGLKNEAVAEMGSIKSSFRSATFEKIIGQAFDNIVNGIKAESSKVM